MLKSNSKTVKQYFGCHYSLFSFLGENLRLLLVLSLISFDISAFSGVADYTWLLRALLTMTVLSRTILSLTMIFCYSKGPSKSSSSPRMLWCLSRPTPWKDALAWGMSCTVSSRFGSSSVIFSRSLTSLIPLKWPLRLEDFAASSDFLDYSSGVLT